MSLSLGKSGSLALSLVSYIPFAKDREDSLIAEVNACSGTNIGISSVREATNIVVKMLYIPVCVFLRPAGSWKALLINTNKIQLKGVAYGLIGPILVSRNLSCY